MRSQYQGQAKLLTSTQAHPHVLTHAAILSSLTTPSPSLQASRCVLQPYQDQFTPDLSSYNHRGSSGLVGNAPKLPYQAHSQPQMLCMLVAGTPTLSVSPPLWKYDFLKKKILNSTFTRFLNYSFSKRGQLSGTAG